MSDKIQAYQYQEVIFTNTSVGADPLSLLWSFPGGIPATGSSSPILVKYEVPGTYSASLTVSDSFGAIKTDAKPGVIDVLTSSFTTFFTQSKTSIKMGEPYALTDGSFGVPVGPTGWYWSLPGGQTASTQNTSISGYTDWNTLTGGYTGSPGSPYDATITLSSGNKYLASSYSSSIRVLKMGLSESMSLNLDISGTSVYKTGILCTPADNTSGGFRSPSSLDLIGSGAVLGLNFSAKGSLDRTVYFHSDSERATLSIGTGFILPPQYGPLVSPGYYGVSSTSYTYFGYPVNDSITLGKYTTPAKDRLVFSEGSTNISSLTTTWGTTIDYIPSIINAVYPNLNSTNSRMFDYQSGGDVYYFPDVANGLMSVYNPCVYSTNYFSALTGEPLGDVYYTVYIYFIKNGIDATIEIEFATTTNDNSNFIFPEDSVSYGDGAIKILNLGINTSGYSTANDFEFVSNPEVNPYPSASTTEPPYISPKGIMLLVKDPAITYIKLGDNSAILNTTFGSLFNTTLPFGLGNTDPSEVNYDSNMVTYYGSCSGLYYEYYGLGGFPYENTITFGGSL